MKRRKELAPQTDGVLKRIRKTHFPPNSFPSLSSFPFLPPFLLLDALLTGSTEARLLTHSINTCKDMVS